MSHITQENGIHEGSKPIEDKISKKTFFCLGAAALAGLCVGIFSFGKISALNGSQFNKPIPESVICYPYQVKPGASTLSELVNLAAKDLPGETTNEQVDAETKGRDVEFDQYYNVCTNIGSTHLTATQIYPTPGSTITPRN